MANQQDVLNSLKSIIDPDFNRDIVSLGFVKNIKIQDSTVELDIELTTPACPVKTEFQNKAEEAVRRLNGVKSVKVNMTSKPPETNRTAANVKSTLKSVKSIIAISSCKGGVGKSTVAAFLAKELAQRGHPTGLVDADLYGPSVPTLFNLRDVKIFGNEQNEIIPVELGSLKIMSFGFLLGDGPAVMRGPIVTRYIQQLIHQTAWGNLDYLIIDMPPGTGDIQLTITQTVQLSGAVIVTTPQTLSLVDVARGILMFEEVKVPILGVIENMSYFVCDNCHKEHFIFGGKGVNPLKERFGVETLARLPIIPELSGKFNQEIKSPVLSETVDKVIMSLGKSTLTKRRVPQVSFDQERIVLRWPEGKEWVVKNRDVRLQCRCAFCVNEITGEVMLKENDIRKDIAPKETTVLGNYALGIKWNDGHSSGIYPYETLQRLSKNK